MASPHHYYGGYQASAGSSGAYRRAQPVETFTAEMRDRQARGKDPYHDSGGSSDETNHWGGRRRYQKYCTLISVFFETYSLSRAVTSRTKDEAFTVTEKRRQASQILDTPELLMMHAARENDSVPATRLRFMRMLCGVEESQQVRTSTTSARKSTSSTAASPRSGGSGKSTPSKRSGGRS
ncbi:hypothetical protein BX600DRAFT_506385 [Xylariales sp. PMI_506]|nr:hypothetical protein BX600DRAFT_506385 [Xylariales sp. PMI_506]